MGVVKAPSGVPLEEALSSAGSGLYTKLLVFSCGLMLFAGIANLQMMAVVMPLASCDLQLTVFQKGFLTSVPFTGIVLSSHLLGFLSDMYGRRKILLVCSGVSAVVSFLSCVSPNFYVLAFSWFIIGFMTGGHFTASYVYLSEFTPKNVRGRCILIASAMCALATGALPCAAWLIIPLKIHLDLFGALVFTSWRFFIAVFPITNLVPFCLLYVLPESPKFVLNRGREEETLEILKKAYSVNNRNSKEPYPVERVVLDQCDAAAVGHKSESGHPLVRMFKTAFRQTAALFSSRYVLYTAMSSLLMMGILGVYNSFVLWVPLKAKLLMLHTKAHPDMPATMCEIFSEEGEIEQAAGSCDLRLAAFLPSILIGISQSTVFLLVSSIADRLDKRYIIVSLAGTACLASVGLVFVNTFVLIVICVGLIISFGLTTYTLALSIAVEFFPTTLRSTAASVILLFGRIASVTCAQVVGFLYRTHCHSAYWTAAALLLGVCLLSITSPSKRKEETEEPANP